MSYHVRPLAPDDHDDWVRLFTAYLDFYSTRLDPEQIELQFRRRLEDSEAEFRCLVAIADDKAVGIAHYLFHRHGWREEQVCYLQDLFVTPEHRDHGVGQTLIGAVFAAADAAGAPKVFWMTENSNRQARKLYDRIGKLTAFVKYER
ncbi:GNAT family N-acetyltransferase [Profundibacterium mesophilum]|uniref:Phospholipiddiacylglycerol acyltransferase n=1 Tax=Profundibacterium mesophilum KAUST100406-0324 TaxID=1037889 RepID=A0A921TGP4_9RHOB|nr:GNAT family N-acetyltransferase [Profundibacterium mesophilum]KAF0677639.1 phospholipiddiacylglycerol acyltransferase [Profundibacterium mesophilum KAUST100406-0324]